MESSGSVLARNNMNVFINCPFDPVYKSKLFEPLLFSIQACGFVSRCALEVTRENDRFKKIQNLIEECEFSIHDLSRNDKGETPRFNMPLELGLFIGCKRYGGGLHINKSYLVLDKKSYEYQKYISDINGEDPEIHLDKPKRIIEIIRNWLCGHLELLHPEHTPDIPSGDNLYKSYLKFKKNKALLCSEFRLNERTLTFVESRRIINEWWNRGREELRKLESMLKSESLAREEIAATED